ncbi:interferon-induced very large GTPase 1-like [Gigaspora margarita]|uniref:Interferon-induced very large GTPase 1-like n=1 Tax=Gigaspora margarita TaxID=4874 RepID=A0A8H3XJQ8_GIGMA|nr:interferon-induced very large GTPase 1-like [Gigaspora margarita]
MEGHREIKNLRNIEPNENVIKFLGVTKEPSKNFYSIVLEYCGNKNLDEDLEDVSKKSWHYKIKMAKDLANGLSYIHMENIILCNLNSKNIISYKDKLVITNFSSAVSLDNQMKPTIEPTIEITDKNVAYVDPKCFNSTKMFNKPSDIYSLGVILWEITSGKPAFYNNQDIEELKISLIYGIRESPIELTPVDYKELYCDAWNKDKHKRPPIKDFINCLDEIDLDLIYHNYDIIQEISYRENNSITKEEACLKIIEGSPRNQYLFLPEGEILVGRNYSNHIVIKDQEINKKHAKIINYHGKVEITCFDSESIIYINEEVFSRSRILKRHDVIKMGRSVFNEIAVQHYKESAQGGNINGQYQLGMCYLDGIGVKKNGILSRPKTILKKNSKKAYMLFMKSAASGNSEAREMLISKFQPSIPPQVSPFLPDENEVLKIDKKWYSILDEKLPLIEPKHYFMLSDLIPQPNLLSNEIHMNVAAVLPYIRQKVKMRDVDILKAENFAKLVIDQEDEESSDDESKVENKKLIKRNRLSRFDCIATLLASAECSVAKDIFQTVPQLPIAFPLLIPDLDNAEKFKVMLPLFIGSTIKCCTSNESIIENHLFEDSFKLIVAVQVGMNTRGKSTILNQLMASENMFTSYSEPRTKYGIPHMIDGSVEFVWLTEETCGDYLWNNVFKNYYEKGRKEIILLANLHGDALRYQDRLEFLKQLPSYFLVFLQPGDEDQKDELKKLIGSKKVRDIYVNPKDNAIKEVYKNFEDVLDSNLGGYSFNELTELEMGETLQLAQNIKCDESQELINFVKDKTCHHTKLEIMQLQKQQFKDEFDFLKFLQSKPELRLFSSIIALRPIKKRIRALTHLEIELSRLFAEESSKLLRNDAILKVNQLNNTSLMNLFKKNNIREDVTKLLEEVDNTNLRIEHFFRGLGYMYTMCKSFVSNPKINDSDNDPIKENILRSPGYYADLLINGYTIELLDGDSTTISEAWFLAVCKYINKRFPDLKIFVISILGLQSSGKSTLLNALFACKFAVSARRCTRGLLMQFLFLEKDLSNKLGVDAFILIDSEGLCAPEKMVGTESEKKDRMLVHFAMQISNLTIINILGNSEEELDKILSITIGIMIILDKSLNIFIVQHAIDNNKVELKQKFHENFQKILRKTVKATDSKMGAHNKEYLSKIEDENLLKIFAPFKNNTASYSPPSKQYHEDIVDLYKSIIKNCENSKNKKKFSKWFQLIKGYWDAVVREDFSFLKINETYDFIELGIQSAKLKEIIDMAFLKHKKLIEYEIRTIVQESLSEGSSVDSIKLKCGELIKKLEGVPEIEIQEDCEECKKVAKERGNLSDYLEERNDIICKKETNQTFSAYIIDCRESKSNELKNMLEDILMRNRFFRQFEFIDRLLEMVLNKQKGIIEIWNLLCEKVSTENKAFMNEKINNKVEKEFEKMWTQDLFENYKNRTIPELSKINAISSFNFFMKKCLEPNDIAWLENEINYVTNQILSKTDNFDPEIVHELKAETEKIMNNLSTKLNIKFNSEFEMKVHAYAILTMLNTLEKGGKHNTLLEVLDKIEVEYKEKIQLRVKYDHLLEYKGHVTGDYLLKAIVKKAIDAESRYRRDHVLSISWMNNSETIRIQYFIELAEQIQNGDKNKLNKVAEHFLFPKEMIEKWFKNKVNECTDKGQKYKETSDQQFDYVRQEIRNCKSYTNIRKFVNKYMTQVDGIDYQLNIKDDSVDKNFEMFHNAIIKELDDKRTGYDQLKAESLPNPSDDKLVEKRLGCTELCYWCGALCWEERGHDNDYGETKRHHTSHQPGGLKGTHYSSTKQLVAMACHNRPNDAIVHYDNKQLRWDKAKSIDFKNWKFEPHYRTNFNEIMCWFFEMLNQNMAEKLYCKPANESELEKHGCFKKDYRKIISVLRQCLENGADN